MAETEKTYYLWNIVETWGNIGFYWTTVASMIEKLEDGYVGLIAYRTVDDDVEETYNEYHTVQDENMGDPSLEDYLSSELGEMLTVSYASTEDASLRERFGDGWYSLTEGSQLISNAMEAYTQQMLNTSPTPELTNDLIKYTLGAGTLSSIDGTEGEGALPAETIITTGATTEGGGY